MKPCSPCRRPLTYCLLALALLAAPAARAAKFVGDYSEWSVYGHDYVPADIPADKLTHVNYAFIIPAGPAQGTDPRTGTHYLLTLAGPGDAYYLSRFDVAGIQPYVDWVDVMSYDFHGCWGGTDHTGHNAPLYGSADDPDGANFSVSQGISDWLSRGMPAAKILLGLPYYGKAFQALKDTGPNGAYPGRYAGVDPAQNDGTTCAPGTWGDDGGLDYWDLAANYVDVNGYVHYWDGQQGVPFLWKDLTRWVTYDDAQSLAGKAAFARSQRLGGVFVWELSLESAPTQVPKAYPLTNAVAGSLNP